MESVILTLLVGWLVLSAVTTVACAAVIRGGADEEQAHARRNGAPIPGRNAEPVAEFPT